MRRGMCDHISCVPFRDQLASSFLFNLCTLGPFSQSSFVPLLLLVYSVAPDTYRMRSSTPRFPFSFLRPISSFITFFLNSLLRFVFLFSFIAFLYFFFPPFQHLLLRDFLSQCSLYVSLLTCLFFFGCTSSACSSFIIASYFLCLSSSCLPSYFLYLLRPHRICDRVFFRVVYCCRAQVCWSLSVTTF